MTRPDMTRRGFLGRSLIGGCSLAASPFLTPVTFAAAPWDARLVVIILRGAMDGLDVVQPWGDPDFARLRGADRAGPDTAGGAIDLDGYFALNPALSGLMPLWNAGELGFVQAVSTPYRDKRSHFAGQDILEAGTADSSGITRSDGWLNRMLQQVPGISAQTTYAIGRGDMLLARGAAPVADWSPEASLGMSAAGLSLMDRVMHEDPLFRDSLAEAVALSGLGDPDDMESAMAGNGMQGADSQAMENAMGAGHSDKTFLKDMAQARRGAGVAEIARFAAQKLAAESRIAAFSLNGWDTHARQVQTLRRPLDRLQTVITTLRDELGPVWGKTAVVAMTEFGRTVALNGTGGTDHGTGGAMVLAGGALRGAKVTGDWPGLSEGALYQGRDLMPTRDVRDHAAWIMRGLFGLSRHDLETAVFPGLDMGADPGLIL